MTCFVRSMAAFDLGANGLLVLSPPVRIIPSLEPHFINPAFWLGCVRVGSVGPNAESASGGTFGNLTCRHPKQSES